jgi:aminoglycoside phosphotransferase (APT) family kinase protein
MSSHNRLLTAHERADGASGADWRMAPTEEQIEAIRRRFPVEPCIDEALTRKMRGRADPPHRPRPLVEVQQALRAFLAKRLDGPVTVANVKPLAGGSSKEQFTFELVRPEQRQRLVVRFETPEATVHTHRLREFQLLRALHGTVPVPEPYWVDAHGSELGAPGLIYAFCRGVSRPPTGTKTSGPQQGYSEEQTRALAPQFVALLGRIATAPWQDADMSAFRIPRPRTIDSALSAIDWWQRVWEEDRVEAVPLASFAARWLRDNAPVTDHVSIVHGDYRTGQFLFDLGTYEITAVLDWELGRLGDRHEDLAYTMFPIFASRDAEGRSLVCGFYPRDEFLDRYQQVCGLRIDHDRLAYYTIYNFWRNFIIGSASSHRVLLTRKTHNDTLAGLSAMVAPTMLYELGKALKKVL